MPSGSTNLHYEVLINPERVGGSKERGVHERNCTWKEEKKGEDFWKVANTMRRDDEEGRRKGERENDR